MNNLQQNIQQTVLKTGLKKVHRVLDAIDDEAKRNKKEVKIITDIALSITALAVVIFVFNVT